jgi:hypothetical protein
MSLLSRPRLLAVVLVFTGLVSSGCESTVDVEVSDHTPQLVVNSLFANGERWAVEVSRTTGAFQGDTLSSPRFTLDDATVTVTAPGDRARTLSYTDTLTREELVGFRASLPGAYTSLESAPEPGQPYIVRVEAGGYEPVEAISRIPAPVPVTVTSTASRLPTDIPIVVQQRIITLRIQDPPGEKNYYWVRIAQFRRNSSREVSFTTRDRSIINDAPSDLDDTGEVTLSRAYFEDALFDGRAHEVDLVVEEGFGQPTPGSGAGEDDPYPYFIVEVGVLSADLYEYLVSARILDETNDNPFAEPVNLYSNVESGYGLVAGRHLRRFTVPSEIVEP